MKDFMFGCLHFLFATILLVLLIVTVDNFNTRTRIMIEELNYNYEQVKTFCRYTDYLLDDFIKDKGIQKQFELFQAGKINFYKRDKYEGTIIMFNPKEMDGER